VYQAVVVARLLYTVIAWWASPRPQTGSEGLTPWCACRILPSEPITDGCSVLSWLKIDDRLFHRVRYVSQHVLQPLLPNRRTDTHFLRERRHHFQLFCKCNFITDCNFIARLLWPPCVADAGIIFLPCGFFLLMSSFPRLISAAADWMSTIYTLTHGVTLVRI